MFSSLSDKLSQSLNKLRGIGRLTEENIKETLREVRIALLEADVALPVVKDFIKQVNEQAVGKEVHKSIRPGDALIKVVNDELTRILGEELVELNLKANPPVVILMAGLQGAGKTTTTAKLARWLSIEHKKKVLMASADVYRPAAILQLKTLAEQIDVGFFAGSDPKKKPVDIAKAAVKEAKNTLCDVLLIDTAGRLQIDDEMMTEISDIAKVVDPTETLLVLDSMAGQDAANVAKQFSDTLPITGAVLTKLDGDARGGAALSMSFITGKPIKFIGIGEKIDAFDAFHPKRMASRILGMGDVLSLVEESERKLDKKQADKLEKKLKKGKRFDFDDFLNQLEQMQKMGGLQGILSKLPGGAGLPKGVANMMDEKQVVHMKAIVQSMTRQEKRFPAVLNGSRKRRIAKGSGTDIQKVNKLLKQFTQMQKMLKKFKGGKMQKQMEMMKGKLPPGSWPME